LNYTKAQYFGVAFPGAKDSVVEVTELICVRQSDWQEELISVIQLTTDNVDIGAVDLSMEADVEHKVRELVKPFVEEDKSPAAVLFHVAELF
jgi:hypothetical protein